MNINNLKIKTRIISMVVLVLIIISSLSGISYYNSDRMAKLDSELYDNLVSIVYLKNINNHFQEIRNDIKELGLAKSGYDKIFASINDSENEITINTNKFEKTIQSEDTRIKFNEFKNNLPLYLEKKKEVVKYADFPDILLQKVQEYKPYAEKVKKSIDDLIALKELRAREKIAYNQNIANNNKNLLIIFTLSSLILFFLIAYFLLIKPITKSLNKIKDYSNAVSQGDMTVKLEGLYKDEIGELGKNLENTVNNIRITISELIDKAKIVNAHAESIKNNNEQIAQASQENAMVMDESARAVQSISANAETISINSKEVNESAEKGNNEIEQVAMQMRKIIEVNKNINESIGVLKKYLSNIGQIAETINEITSKTELYSFNAKIESAKAGEFGKGFEVVAGEIGKLAERSRESLKDIMNLVKQINEQTKNAVENINLGNKEIENGEKVIQQTYMNFKDITNSIQNLNDEVQSVSSALEEITSSIENVSASTQEQSASTEETTVLTQNLFNLSQELIELSNKFKI